MTPAEEMRQAADRLDSLTENASQAPWRAFPAGRSSMANVRVQGEYGPMQGIVYRIERDADAQYIAAMHPGVGALLVKLLRATAELLDEYSDPASRSTAELLYAEDLAVARELNASAP